MAGSCPWSAEMPRAARRALRRRRSRAGALARGHFDHADSPRRSTLTVWSRLVRGRGRVGVRVRVRVRARAR
eukprot:scaffold27609_cov39-Phaeocystis_antarctica.AAC.2